MTAQFASGHRAIRSALALVGFGLIACAPLHSAQAKSVSFQCEGGRSLIVTHTGNGVSVSVGERRYLLKPKASSLGQRYASPHASLIVDGSFAAFVADDLFDLEGCHSS